MAREMLRITVMGSLSIDAQSRLSAEDRPITHFRTAVNQTRTNPAGGREERRSGFRSTLPVVWPNTPLDCGTASESWWMADFNHSP
jgi:hypothetical protein